MTDVVVKSQAALQVPGEQKSTFPLSTPLSEGYIIGRSDAQSVYPPDIDLAPLQGRDRGVSRRHAALVTYGGELHILDLDSVNGTFVNNKRLLPESPYALRHGDRILLGDFELLFVQEKA
jgi:pSer/pThr/pTyr-binding forkhead associated (FHA) protein